MFMRAFHTRTSWFRFLSVWMLAMAMGHAGATSEPGLREGLECGTGRTISFRLHQGWAHIGDIIIGREAEIASACIRMPQGLSAAQKDSMKNAALRWPDGVVPYFINPQMTPSTREVIAKVVKHFADYTPIRLVPYTGQNDFVGFEDLKPPPSAGNLTLCGLSFVGRQGGGQPINLNQSCGGLFGHALHEVMHALGFLHEHERSDRDAYVAVKSVTENSSCAPTDYMIDSGVSFGPYDYASIMHYDAACLRQLRPFSIPLTLYKDSDPECKPVTNIGQKCALSDGDFFALWHFYRPATAPRPALTSAQRNAALEVVQRTVKASSRSPPPPPPSPATASSPGELSGLWWGGLSENGWGISFTQRGPNIFAAWFTYDQAGTPIWYVATNCSGVSSGATSGTCTGTLFRVNGRAFFGVAFTPINQSDLVSVGNLQVTFQGTNSAVMSYSLVGQSRTVSITRQQLATGASPPAINYTDLWWAGPQENGWGMAITQQYDIIFIAWYVYDSAGRPIWYAASNCPVVANGCSGTLYRTVGPPGPSFNAAGNQVLPVGSIDISFSDPNNGTIRFIVNGVSGSKAITRQLF